MRIHLWCWYSKGRYSICLRPIEIRQSNGGKISIPMGASHKHGASNCCLANTLVVALTRMILNPKNDLRKTIQLHVCNWKYENWWHAALMTMSMIWILSVRKSHTVHVGTVWDADGNLLLRVFTAMFPAMFTLTIIVYNQHPSTLYPHSHRIIHIFCHKFPPVRSLEDHSQKTLTSSMVCFCRDSFMNICCEIGSIGTLKWIKCTS
jgi:hypothetical protein